MNKLEVWMKSINQLNLIIPKFGYILDEFFHPSHGFQSKPEDGKFSIISHARCIEASHALTLNSDLDYAQEDAQKMIANLFLSQRWTTGESEKMIQYPISVAIPSLSYIIHLVDDTDKLTELVSKNLGSLVEWIEYIETKRLSDSPYESDPMLHGMFLYRVRKAFAVLERDWIFKLAKFKDKNPNPKKYFEDVLRKPIKTLDKFIKERFYYFISMCSAIPINEEDALQLAYLVYSLEEYSTFRNDVLIEHALEIALTTLFRKDSVPRLQLLYRDNKLNISGTPIEVLTLLSKTRLVRRHFDCYWNAFHLAYEWLKATQRDAIFSDSSVPCWMAEPWRGVGKAEAWINAAVIEFFTSYNEMLHEVCANEINIEFGATTSQPKFQWKQIIDFKEFKKELETAFFPLIKEDLKKKGKLRKASIILFGPAGTSKTSIAKAIAYELGIPFVELKPHHFAEEGTDGVIRRAKDVFRSLFVMRRCLVFFDEIDELVASRDRDVEQEKIGRFITTSVLPWFQELRDLAQIVFIVATNHVENFDPAIRRPGRFDYVLPIGPPDRKSRKELLLKLLEADIPDKNSRDEIINILDTKVNEIKYAVKIKNNDDNEKIEKVSWAVTIGELVSISESIVRDRNMNPKKNDSAIIENVVGRFAKKPLIPPEDMVNFNEQIEKYKYPL
ncbi:MAG: AAA family ATPase [Candidatus Zixiibacteriota bacterium]